MRKATEWAGDCPKDCNGYCGNLLCLSYRHKEDVRLLESSKAHAKIISKIVKEAEKKYNELKKLI